MSSKQNLKRCRRDGDFRSLRITVHQNTQTFEETGNDRSVFLVSETRDKRNSTKKRRKPRLLISLKQDQNFNTFPDELNSPPAGYEAFATNSFNNFNMNNNYRFSSGPFNNYHDNLDFSNSSQTHLPIPSYDILIDPQNIICFSGRNNFLSNFFMCSITINGNVYPSVEHYYQATKLFMLGGPGFGENLREIANPMQAKVITRNLLCPIAGPENVERWRREKGPAILLYALRQKFCQNPELGMQLLNTGNALLAHCYESDGFYGTQSTDQEVKMWAQRNEGRLIKVPQDMADHHNFPYLPIIGNGLNVLGFICMQIRNVLREQILCSDLNPSYRLSFNDLHFQFEEDDSLYVS